MSRNPDVQLRFVYQAPAKGLRVHLCLRGMTVTARDEDGDVSALAAFFDHAGVRATFDDLGLASFPASQIRSLTALPPRVVLLPDKDLRVLLDVYRAVGGEGTVVVSTDAPDVLNLSWLEGVHERNEPLSLRCAAALLALGVTVVADPSTWSVLHGSTLAQTVTVRARANLDGFVELTSSTPQVVESLDVPGLFRLNDARFGVPLPVVDLLDDVPGLMWSGPRPGPVVVPSTLPATGFVALPGALAERVAAARAQALVGGNPSQRRALALSVFAAFDAFPLTVFCHPSQILVWDAVCRSHGMSPVSAGPGGVSVRTSGDDPRPVTLISYGSRSDRSGPAAVGVLFDDLDRAVASGAWPGPTVVGDVHAYRLSCTSSVPADGSALASFFQALRPVEFRGDLPAALRYRSPVDARLRVHAGLYTFPLDGSGCPVTRPGPVGDVETVLVGLPVDADARDPGSDVVAELQRYESGDAHVVGAKVAAAVALAAPVLAARIPVTVVVSTVRASRLVRRLLRNDDLLEVVVGMPADASSVSSTFVVVAAPLRSHLELRALLGDPVGGSWRVRVVHTDTRLEDRLAVVAASRADNGLGSGADFTAVELEYLLGSPSR